MTEAPTPPPITTAELEAKCRKIIGDMIAEGQAGKLDTLVLRALSKGLRQRGLSADAYRR